MFCLLDKVVLLKNVIFIKIIERQDRFASLTNSAYVKTFLPSEYYFLNIVHLKSKDTLSDCQAKFGYLFSPKLEEFRFCNIATFYSF